jgi:AraC family transcriptional regulator of adaptative response/methylated-DNA-[protein]-cysteine methyltransferase
MNDSVNYDRIERAIRYLATRVEHQPSLEEVAAHSHLSPHHFQRLFTQWAGISPKKFLQYLTVKELKRELASSRSVLEAADRVGLSAQSRVYDHFVAIEAVSPREYTTGATGVKILYGFHPTPFGEACLALSPRGICSVEFAPAPANGHPAHLRRRFPKAELVRSDAMTRPVAKSLFAPNGSFTLDLKGTAFQVKVWEALLRVPFGQVTSYAELAREAGSPSAVRAVGSAVAANPVAWLIPCHRVIRNEGVIGDYHWGPERKTAMIGWERAQLEARRA